MKMRLLFFVSGSMQPVHYSDADTLVKKNVKITATQYFLTVENPDPALQRFFWDPISFRGTIPPDHRLRFGSGLQNKRLRLPCFANPRRICSFCSTTLKPVRGPNSLGQERVIHPALGMRIADRKKRERFGITRYYGAQ
jgi:hypothetical protein